MKKCDFFDQKMCQKWPKKKSTLFCTFWNFFSFYIRENAENTQKKHDFFIANCAKMALLTEKQLVN